MAINIFPAKALYPLIKTKLWAAAKNHTTTGKNGALRFKEFLQRKS